MREGIVTGQVLKTRGLRGEVKIRMADARKNRFTARMAVETSSGRKLTVCRFRAQEMFGFLQFEEITSVEEAQNLVGENLLVEEESLPAPEKDHYYVKDLEGMKVYREDDTLLGDLEEVIENRAQDLYRIRTTEGKELLLPAVKEFIRQVDVANHSMHVHLIGGME